MDVQAEIKKENCSTFHLFIFLICFTLRYYYFFFVLCFQKSSLPNMLNKFNGISVHQFINDYGYYLFHLSFSLCCFGSSPKYFLFTSAYIQMATAFITGDNSTLTYHLFVLFIVHNLYNSTDMSLYHKEYI